MVIDSVGKTSGNPGSSGVRNVKQSIKDSEFMRQLREIESSMSPDAKKYLTEGHKAFFQGNYKRAAEMFDKAVELGYRSPTAPQPVGARPVMSFKAYREGAEELPRGEDGRLTGEQSDYLMNAYGTADWDAETRAAFYGDMTRFGIMPPLMGVYLSIDHPGARALGINVKLPGNMLEALEMFQGYCADPQAGARDSSSNSASKSGMRMSFPSAEIVRFARGCSIQFPCQLPQPERKLRQIAVDYIPDQRLVYSSIIVYNTVAQSSHFMPRNVAMCSRKPFVKQTSQFSDLY
jgi:hypothetical protein